MLNASALDVVGNYPDISRSDWYYDAVEFCTTEKYITGFANGRFGPLQNIQRQDFVLILARIAGVNLNKWSREYAVATFSDVNDLNAYYTRALTWGHYNGIVNGYNNGKFGVGDLVTREQLCVFIFRYVNRNASGSVVTAEMRTRLLGFKDGSKVSAFAKDAVAWCVYKGVINGTKDGYLNPTKAALRCEVAQIIYNACQNDIINSWKDI